MHQLGSFSCCKNGQTTDLKLRGTCSTISKQEVGIDEEPKATDYASHGHDTSVEVVNVEVGAWGDPKYSRIESSRSDQGMVSGEEKRVYTLRELRAECVVRKRVKGNQQNRSYRSADVKPLSLLPRQNPFKFTVGTGLAELPIH